MSEIIFVAAAALMLPGGSVLLQKRPEGGSMASLWEFPGGKVEQGETPEAALVRELEEEIGIEVLPRSLEPLAFATGRVGGRQLILLLYLCDRWKNDPQLLHAAEMRWVLPGDMHALAMPPADVPLVDALVRYCASGAQPVK
jgi:8-oxo-dGTP diphosphatase